MPMGRVAFSPTKPSEPMTVRHLVRVRLRLRVRVRVRVRVRLRLRLRLRAGCSRPPLSRPPPTSA